MMRKYILPVILFVSCYARGMDNNDIVVLKDGVKANKYAVTTTMRMLKDLKSDPKNLIVFCELVKKSRDPKYNIWGGKATEESLKNKGFDLSHEGTRDLIRNSVEGDGLAMRIVDPIKK